jgi:hypothetical protein
MVDLDLLGDELSRARRMLSATLGALGQSQIDANHTWISVCGRAVHTGCRQSIPSTNIDSCAAVSDTLPSFACGHTKRPFSSRLA